MTKKEYVKYERRFAEWHDSVQFPSSGYCPGCAECCEEHFSWYSCPICGTHLGGNRYPVHYVDSDGEIEHIDACTDCVYYLEYGRLDDQTMLDMDQEEGHDDFQH